jgi:hypothetical protein
MTPMGKPLNEPDQLDRDPVFQLLVTGQARTLEEAEKVYLDSALPEAYALLASGLSDEELGRHPLLVMYRRHGSRGWEDSIL